MIDPSVERELLEQLGHLGTDQQHQVLAFARKLAVTRPIGAAGASYMAFAGTIDAADLDLMTQAIEAGCEQVHAGDW